MNTKTKQLLNAIGVIILTAMFGILFVISQSCNTDYWTRCDDLASEIMDDSHGR